MTTALAAALEAFYVEHEYCGELESDVEDDRTWMTLENAAQSEPTIRIPRETSQSSTNRQLAGSSRCQRSIALAGIATTRRP